MVLNWCEIGLLAKTLACELAQNTWHVDKVFAREQPRFAAGFLKNEWVLRLQSRKLTRDLVLSVRPQHPYALLLPANTKSRVAPQATRSVFDLSLSKSLQGLRLKSLEALPFERSLRLDFEPDLTLLVNLIPALPEALLLQREDRNFRVLARSRPTQKLEASYALPDGQKAPRDLKARAELATAIETGSYTAQIQEELNAESLALKRTQLGKNLREMAKHHEESIRKNTQAIAEAKAEADWQRQGELLKTHLAIKLGEGQDLRSTKASSYLVNDYEKQTELTITCDIRLTLVEQIDKFFANAKRRERRLSQAQERKTESENYLQGLSLALAALPDADWETLKKTEETWLPHTAQGQTKDTKTALWPGKRFVSKEGLSIWVGRSKAENLELTFKCARGNDLWMHVKGRPGSHVLIPLHSGKSASLETLLDAAQLVVFYSGGKNWGSTEVDYTFKKYVKRIRDSQEASYTHNKTLIIKPDAERLKRLLGEGPL